MGIGASVDGQNETDRLGQLQVTVDGELDKCKDEPGYRLYRILKPLDVYLEEKDGTLYIEAEFTSEEIFKEIGDIFGEENVKTEDADKYSAIAIKHKGGLLNELRWLSVVNRPVGETITELFNPENYQDKNGVYLNKGCIKY